VAKLHVVNTIARSKTPYLDSDEEVTDTEMVHAMAPEQARDHHVTVIASSGDNGAIADDGPPRQVSMPASDPLVLAVGGTILDIASPGGAGVFTGYTAGPGWDPVTGWGSPDAQYLVPLLAHAAHSGS
jgi:hypothetical protein